MTELIGKGEGIALRVLKLTCNVISSAMIICTINLVDHVVAHTQNVTNEQVEQLKTLFFHASLKQCYC